MRSWFARAVAFLTVLAVTMTTVGVAGLGLAAPAAAYGVLRGVAVSCQSIYAIEHADPHTLSTVNPTTGVLTPIATLASTTPASNALAVDSIHNVLWLVDQAGGQTGSPTIRSVDPQSGVVTTFTGTPLTAPAANGGIVMGAFNPVTAIYYYGIVSGGTLYIYGFNTNTNTAIAGETARVAFGGAFNNGDFAFDGEGRLYVATSGALYVIDAALPTTGAPTGPSLPFAEISPIAGAGTIGAVAFGADGYLYVGIGGAGGTVSKINPSTGAEMSSAVMTPTSGISDFASCAEPNVIRVQKNLPSGRAVATDQFNLSVTGGGLAHGNAGTTAGTETGVQNQQPYEVAGPVLGLAGTSYSISETGAAGANLDSYMTSWQCVDVANGSVQVASGAGSSGSFVMPAAAGTAGTDVLCTFTNTPVLKSISLVKSVQETTLTAAGQVLHYNFAVTNTGTVALAQVTVAETAFTGKGTAPVITCPAGTSSLAPSQSITCTATYVATQADIDAGTITNTAVAAGTPPTDSPVRSDPSTVVLRATQSPGLSFSKAADASKVTSPAQVGQAITYLFSSQNTGNVTLTGVTITDGLAGLSARAHTWPGTPGTLLPGQTVTASANYWLAQTDLDAGHVKNTATVAGTPPTGTPITPPLGSTDTPLVQGPGLSLAKGADASAIHSPARPGDVILFHFTAKNTGNVTLTNVAVTDLMAGLSGLVTPGPEPPGRCCRGNP
ncbi:hypothetical protein [Arthrobacter sp. NA-172]|uniref:DUF7507 domain-containing protein n=1 Tax=Arthrobacter sp. NA-172 TaxID=3367524 RepID=UPI003754C610